MDMSVPEHVLLDPHPIDTIGWPVWPGDGYETYTKDYFKDIGINDIFDYSDEIMPYYGAPQGFYPELCNLFYSLAEKADNFNSVDYPGEGGENCSYFHYYPCLQKELQTRAVAYTVELYKLFWRLTHPQSPLTGYASVSQLTISPSSVTINSNFNISFTLQEVRGASKTFEQVVIAIVDANNNNVFDFATYYNETISAYGTLSKTAANYLYPTRPPGTYKAVIRGLYNGEWFPFDTTGSGVNPKSFYASASASVSKPDIVVQNVSLNKTTFYPGESVNVSTTIKNISSVNISNDVKVKYYLTSGYNIAASPVSFDPWDNIKSYNLTAGVSKDEDTSTSAPLTPGVYNISVWADPDNGGKGVIDESDETNNWSPPIVFNVVPQPDIVVQNVYLSKTTLYPGEPFRVTATTQNISSGDIDKDIRIKYYLASGYNIAATPVSFDNDNIRYYHLTAGSSRNEYTDTTAPTVAGTYNISVQADVDNSITESNETNNWSSPIIFTVVQPPALAASFSRDVSVGNAPLTVKFTDASTGQITGWTWNFGDGYTSYEQSPSHTYASAGSYTVTLTITGTGGSNTKTWTGCVTVNTAPKPDIVVQNVSLSKTTTLLLGESFRVTTKIQNIGSVNVSNDVRIKYYLSNGYSIAVPPVSFDSDTILSSNLTAGSIKEEYTDVLAPTTAGTYNISVCADVDSIIAESNESNNCSSAIIFNVVQPTPFVASFTRDVSVGNAPLTVKFTDASTGPIGTWAWDFGDGLTSNERNPSHTYTSEGSYTVSLTITGTGGSNTKTWTGCVTVNSSGGTTDSGLQNVISILRILAGINSVTVTSALDATHNGKVGIEDAIYWLQIVAGLRTGVSSNLPDLIVSSLVVTSFNNDSPIYSINYDYTITNIGNAPANLDGPIGEDHKNVSVQAFISADTIFNNAGDIGAGGTILGLSPLGQLAPGESRSGSNSCGFYNRVDTSVTPYLILKVDWSEVVNESDENNNTLAVPIKQ